VAAVASVIVFRVIVAAVAALNGITVEMVSPAPGATLTNSTFTLEATASSLAGPITKVEYYDVHTWTNYATHQVFTVTNLMGTVTNKLPPGVKNLFVY
jgi:hypothetical protein